MTNLDASVAEGYRKALCDYLLLPKEATLQQAYELGRAAMRAGLGILDLVHLHHRAFAHGVLSGEIPAATGRCLPALESFLLAVLSSFEGAYRSFRSTRERLLHLNEVLAERNDELALVNAQLEEEISIRRRVEAALRESKDHYFQLFQQARTMEENLRDLSARALLAQEEERKRISRELHDEIGQALIAVNVAIALLKKQARAAPAFRRKVAKAERLLAHAMETVHCFARELRPAMLDHLGVESALRSHLANFSQRTGIRTELISHPNLDRIDGPRGEVLFRVVQEALNNVFKHAKATVAKVEFSSAAENLGMVISDNGCAICGGENPGIRRTGRLGLIGMEERVRLVHGTFAIDSVSGRGTRILVQIPLESRTPRVPPAETMRTALALSLSIESSLNHDEKNIRAAR